MSVDKVQAKTAVKLAPCPFCGGRPEKVYRSTGQTTQIVCSGCRAQFPRSTNECMYDDAWNRRAYVGCRCGGL